MQSNIEALCMEYFVQWYKVSKFKNGSNFVCEKGTFSQIQSYLYHTMRADKKCLFHGLPRWILFNAMIIIVFAYGISSGNYLFQLPIKNYLYKNNIVLTPCMVALAVMCTKGRAEKWYGF